MIIQKRKRTIADKPIEITGLNVPQSNLISNNQNYANISAIVSKQYDSDDIVTGFADSAIPYVHRGLPVKLSSARVRILDPISKEFESPYAYNANSPIWIIDPSGSDSIFENTSFLSRTSKFNV